MNFPAEKKYARRRRQCACACVMAERRRSAHAIEEQNNGKKKHVTRYPVIYYRSVAGGRDGVKQIKKSRLLAITDMRTDRQTDRQTDKTGRQTDITVILYHLLHIMQ